MLACSSLRALSRTGDSRQCAGGGLMGEVDLIEVFVGVVSKDRLPVDLRASPFDSARAAIDAVIRAPKQAPRTISTADFFTFPLICVRGYHPTDEVCDPVMPVMPRLALTASGARFASNSRISSRTSSGRVAASGNLSTPCGVNCAPRFALRATRRISCCGSTPAFSVKRICNSERCRSICAMPMRSHSRRNDAASSR